MEVYLGTDTVAYYIYPLPAVLASYRVIGSCPVCSTSSPVPSLLQGKTVKDGSRPWAPATCGRPRGNSWILVSHWLSFGSYSHLGNEPVVGNPLSLPVFFFLCKSAVPIKKKIL